MEDMQEFIDPHADISAAYNALEAIDWLNVYDKETAERAKEIKEMSLKIIYEAIQIIYSCYGEEKEAD